MGAWPLTRAPHAHALEQAPTGRVPAAALAVRVHPDLTATDPGALARAGIAVRIVWHPSLVALLNAAGATWLSATRVRVPAAQVPALTARVHPGVWENPEVVGVTPEIGPGPGRLLAQVTSRSLTVTLRSDPVAGVTTTRVGMVTADQLVAVVAAARKVGLIVVDADAPGRLADLGWLYDRRVQVGVVRSAPGFVQVTCGHLVTAPAVPVGPAPATVTAARPRSRSVPFVTDRWVRALCATPPVTPVTARPLLVWQEEFVRRYVANGIGLVNALPPGAGKTAAALAAMATVAGGDHLGVVVAPASVVEHWAGEAARFHPSAAVVSDPDLIPDRGDTLVLLSPGQAARMSPGRRIDDLVVDEATFLRSPSAQTQAVWALRGAARRAAALSGTPQGSARGTVEAMVRFVAGRPDWFTGSRPAAVRGLDPLEAAGGWVFGAGTDLTEVVPQVHQDPAVLAATRVEQIIEDVARSRVRALLADAPPGSAARSIVPALRATLTSWRTALADPTALVASSSAFAAQVRAAWEAAGEVPRAGKVELVAERLPSWGPTVVFADTTHPLEALAAAAPVEVGVLSGKVRPGVREQLVARFTAGDLGVLAVAGVGQFGVNLQAAARVVHLDTPASAASAAQRVARAVRFGAAHPQVTVTSVVVAGTVEERWPAVLAGGSLDVFELAEALVR